MSQQPFRPTDAIPDQEDFTVAQDGRHVRKGTFKAFVDNVFLLDELLQLPEGQARKQKITACVEAIQETAQGLYSVGIFDRIFAINEWIQNEQKIGRIIATLACLEEFVPQLEKNDKLLLKERLQELELTLRMPEINELIVSVLKKLTHL